MLPSQITPKQRREDVFGFVDARHRERSNNEKIRSQRIRIAEINRPEAAQPTQSTTLSDLPPKTMMVMDEGHNPYHNHSHNAIITTVKNER
jgi:hypothetical protein